MARTEKKADQIPDCTKTETLVFSLLDENKYTAAATETLRAHGPEIVRFLMAVLRDESEASECFSIFCETFWKSLPDYRRECSLRNWCYLLARRAISHRGRDPHRQPGRVIALSQSPEVARLAEQVRSTTLAFMKTEVKDRFARLRQMLSLEEQTLLVLRVDRQLSWAEIAQITLDATQPAPEVIGRKEASTRKQFQRIKQKLSRLAHEHGLLQKP